MGGTVGAAAAMAAAMFGMLALGCGSDGGGAGVAGSETSGELNGTYGDTDGDETLILNNGNFESQLQGVPAFKGNYSTSGSTFTMTVTQVYGAFLSDEFSVDVNSTRWYTKSEMKTILQNELGLSSTEFESYFGEMFVPQTGTYTYSDGILSMQIHGETTNYVRDGGNSGGTGGGGGNNGGVSGLNGTWGDGRGYVITFDNGSIIMKYPIVAGHSAVNVAKGTYSLSADNLVVTFTHIHGDALNVQFEQVMPGLSIESKWYTKPELKNTFKNLMGEADYAASGIDAIIEQQLYITQQTPYTLNGNTLVFGGSTYTRQQLLSKAIAGGVTLPAKGSDFDIGVCLRDWLSQ
jgi:hypothetical protein